MISFTDRGERGGVVVCSAYVEHAISFTDRGKRGGVEQDRVCETVEPATALVFQAKFAKRIRLEHLFDKGSYLLRW